MVLASSPPSIPICRERVLSVQRQEDHATCALANGTNVLVSLVLARHLGIGDEITFPISSGDKTGIEIYIIKSSVLSRLNRCLYQAPIGYVTQPKLDKRNQHFVSAEVQQKALGLWQFFSPAEPYATISTACQKMPLKMPRPPSMKPCVFRRVRLQQSSESHTGGEPLFTTFTTTLPTLRSMMTKQRILR
jgi:hypothetical protein